MSNNNNQINVPEAKEAMNRFKMECANDRATTATSLQEKQVPSAVRW